MGQADTPVNTSRLDQWWHTAAVMSQLANAHRDPKKPPLQATQFLPPDLQKEVKQNSSHTGGMKLTKRNLHLLKPLFKK